MNVVNTMFADSQSRVEGYRKAAASSPAGPRGSSGSSLSRDPSSGAQSTSGSRCNAAQHLAQYRTSKKDNPYIAIRPIAMRLAALPIRIGTKKTKVVSTSARMTKGYFVDHSALASGVEITTRRMTTREKFLMPEMFKD